MIQFIIPVGRLVILTLAALTISGTAHAESALCLVATQPEILVAPARAQIHFVLRDESSAGKRQLVARATIVRVTRRFAGLRLLNSLSSIKTASIEQYTAFCGDTFTGEIDLGQMVEATWQIQDRVGLELAKTVYDRSFDLGTGESGPEFTNFVQALATQLDAHVGQIKSTALTAVPDALTGETAIAAFTKMLGRDSDLARGVIESRQAHLTLTQIHDLQSGHDLGPGIVIQK